MATTDRRLYVGPSLRRLRRDLGLTQADMAADLEVSASYIALLERNHRPLSAEVLLRLYTAYREEQLALADRGVEPQAADAGAEPSDPVAESRRFLEARRNSFPGLDDAAERLAQAVAGHDNLAGYFKARHDLRVRRLPPEVMVGSTRRLDRHRREILLSDELDNASQTFQLALQLAYLEMAADIDGVMEEGSFSTESAERLTRRALASYAAAAILMPYSAFARAVETRRYDVEAIARQFGSIF